VAENVYFTLSNMALDLTVRGVCLFVLGYAHQHRLLDPVSSVVIYWLVLILFEDFMFYWLHRFDHHCRFFWAIHVTHHSSDEFNLTVGFRSSILQPLYRFMYFVPIALAGFHPADIMFAYSAAQIFGILAHTQLVNKLGWLEYVLVTPSHHRVHHACNIRYLDRNMGMLLIIWDKLFGTFEAEDEKEKIRFGLLHPVNTSHPGRMIFHEWQEIWHDLRQPGCTWKDRLMYVFGPPGWSHDGTRKTSAQLRAELAPQKANGDHGGD
jgi:sterol desaturase/sphingolipid hydroxylase (fatty acid hydroxylase superfamily)